MTLQKMLAARWNISILLLLFLFISRTSGKAQVLEKSDPSPTEFIEMEQEPVPLNLDSIRAQIVYPAIVRDTATQGRVFLRIMLDTLGNYVKHIVLKSSHDMWTHAIEKHISALRCSPAISFGKPTRVWYNFPFLMCSLGKPEKLLDPDFTYPEPGSFISYERDAEFINLDSVAKNIPYPRDFRENYGRVIVFILFDADGKYVKHLMKHSTNTLLTEVTSDHLPELRVHPAIQEGHPVPSWVPKRFEFHYND